MFDAVQVRSLYLAKAYTVVATLVSTTVALKLVLLLFEGARKTVRVKDKSAGLSLEERSSTFERDFFWWLLSLFRRGYSSVLTIEDLDYVDSDMSSFQRHQYFARNWENCKIYSHRSLMITLLLLIT